MGDHRLHGAAVLLPVQNGEYRPERPGGALGPGLWTRCPEPVGREEPVKLVTENTGRPAGRDSKGGIGF